MAQKFFSILGRETNGLHQAAYLLGLFALLSQILALIRDKLLAYSFGAGVELDIYYAAFRIPDFIFITVGSLVSLSVLIPFLSEHLGRGGEEGKRYIDSVFTTFLVLVVGICLGTFFLMPILSRTLFPGFSDVDASELTRIGRILLLSPVFLGVSNLFASITQIRNRFLVYSLSPVLYNIGIIVGIIFLYPVLGLAGLAWGVLLGALLHTLIHLPVLRTLGYIPRLTARPDMSFVRETALLSVPRTLALSLNHIAVLILISFATLLPPGSIAVFNFSFNLQSVPLSVIGVSYSLAAFPALSRLFALGNRDDFLLKCVEGARHIIFWSVPIAIFFIVLRAHIVRVVLGAGEFDWSDTRLTAACLALFLFSLVFQCLSLLMIRALYAAGDTKVPLLSNIFSAVVIVGAARYFLAVWSGNIVFRSFLESLFKVSDLIGTEALILSLSFAIGSFVGTSILWFFFERRFRGFTRAVLPTFLRSIAAGVFTGFAIFAALRLFDDFFSLEHFWGVFLQAFFSGLVGIAVGIATLALLKSPELRDMWAVLHQKFWKTKVIGPDPEVV